MDTVRRYRIGDLCLRDLTLNECIEVEQALREWLHDNPEDWTMYDLVHMIVTCKAAALEALEESERAENDAARPSQKEQA